MPPERALDCLGRLTQVGRVSVVNAHGSRGGGGSVRTPSYQVPNEPLP